MTDPTIPPQPETAAEPDGLCELTVYWVNGSTTTYTGVSSFSNDGGNIHFFGRRDDGRLAEHWISSSAYLSVSKSGD